jgi:hypothetical protein
MYMKRVVSFILALVLCLAPALQATTTQSNVATVALTATVSSTLTVSVSTTSLTFTDGNPSTPISVTTSWNVSTQFSGLDTVAYFASSTALSGATGAIPTSAVVGIGAGGSGPCSQQQIIGGITFSNACVDVFNVNSTAGMSGTNTSPFQLSIPTLASFPPGSYTGVLNITAIAF